MASGGAKMGVLPDLTPGTDSGRDVDSENLQSSNKFNPSKVLADLAKEINGPRKERALALVRDGRGGNQGFIKPVFSKIARELKLLSEKGENLTAIDLDAFKRTFESELHKFVFKKGSEPKYYLELKTSVESLVADIRERNFSETVVPKGQEEVKEKVEEAVSRERLYEERLREADQGIRDVKISTKRRSHIVYPHKVAAVYAELDSLLDDAFEGYDEKKDPSHKRRSELKSLEKRVASYKGLHPGRNADLLPSLLILKRDLLSFIVNKNESENIEFKEIGIGKVISSLTHLAKTQLEIVQSYMRNISDVTNSIHSLQHQIGIEEKIHQFVGESSIYEIEALLDKSKGIQKNLREGLAAANSVLRKTELELKTMVDYVNPVDSSVNEETINRAKEILVEVENLLRVEDIEVEMDLDPTFVEASSGDTQVNSQTQLVEDAEVAKLLKRNMSGETTARMDMALPDDEFSLERIRIEECLQEARACISDAAALENSRNSENIESWNQLYARTERNISALESLIVNTIALKGLEAKIATLVQELKDSKTKLQKLIPAPRIVDASEAAPPKELTPFDKAKLALTEQGVFESESYKNALKAVRAIDPSCEEENMRMTLIEAYEADPTQFLVSDETERTKIFSFISLKKILLSKEIFASGAYNSAHRALAGIFDLGKGEASLRNDDGMRNAVVVACLEDPSRFDLSLNKEGDLANERDLEVVFFSVLKQFAEENGFPLKDQADKEKVTPEPVPNDRLPSLEMQMSGLTMQSPLGGAPLEEATPEDPRKLAQEKLIKAKAFDAGSAYENAFDEILKLYDVGGADNLDLNRNYDKLLNAVLDAYANNPEAFDITRPNEHSLFTQWLHVFIECAKANSWPKKEMPLNKRRDTFFESLGYVPPMASMASFAALGGAVGMVALAVLSGEGTPDVQKFNGISPTQTTHVEPAPVLEPAPVPKPQQFIYEKEKPVYVYGESPLASAKSTEVAASQKPETESQAVAEQKKSEPESQSQAVDRVKVSVGPTRISHEFSSVENDWFTEADEQVVKSTPPAPEKPTVLGFFKNLFTRKNN